jgi:hypothetical protein
MCSGMRGRIGEGDVVDVVDVVGGVRSIDRSMREIVGDRFCFLPFLCRILVSPHWCDRNWFDTQIDIYLLM